MTFRPKQLARFGEFNLEESILDVLPEACAEGECLGAAEIGRRAGIFREPGNSDKGQPKGMNDAIVHGMLIKLSNQNRVRRCEQTETKRGGWELTQEENERRRDDIQRV